MHHSHRTLHSDDQDFKHAVEEALQWVEDAEQLPKLSLFQGDDDEDGSSDRLFEVPACCDESSVEDLVLFQGEAKGHGIHSEAVRSPAGVPTQVDLPEAAEAFPVGDQSATQDLILCEPPEANTRMLQVTLDSDDLPEEPEAEATTNDVEESSPEPVQNLPFRPIPTKTSPLRPGKTPDRIGQGKLVSARLTWKPGDPFGDGKPRPVEQFSWESMLTSACITAACGLFCVWLLRSLLA